MGFGSNFPKTPRRKNSVIHRNWVVIQPHICGFNQKLTQGYQPNSAGLVGGVTIVSCPSEVDVSKNRGIYPKMDGENNGKPENLLKHGMIWGGFVLPPPIFGLTPKSSRLEFSGSLTVMIHQKILTANNPLSKLNS